MRYVDDDLSFLDDEMTSLGNELFSIFFSFFSNENGGVVAVEELLVMVGNVLEPAAAEVAEGEAEVAKVNSERNSLRDDAILSSRKEKSSST